MNKQRDSVKGKVKRILRERKDMGQLSDSAINCHVSVLQVFLHELGMRLQEETKRRHQHVITPICLKSCVLAHEDMEILHDKVLAIEDTKAVINMTKRSKQTQCTKKKRSIKRPSVKLVVEETKILMEQTQTLQNHSIKIQELSDENENYDESDSE